MRQVNKPLTKIKMKDNRFKIFKIKLRKLLIKADNKIRHIALNNNKKIFSMKNCNNMKNLMQAFPYKEEIQLFWGN